MRNIYQLYLISALFISGVTNATYIQFKINGLPEALERNVYSRLSKIKNEKIIINQGFFVYVEREIRKGLKALGYYKPEISFELHSLTKENQILIAHISPGKPIRISNVSIILNGDIEINKDYQKLLNNCPKLGSILNHGDYEDFKRSLIQIALNKGYFDYHFNKSQLNISLNCHQASWYIDYTSGTRYSIDSVTFEGSQIRNEYLQKLIPFKKKCYYQSNYLTELNRRLAATGWFDSVMSVLEFDKVNKTKMLPLRSILLPSPKNSVDVNVSYSTDVGPHMKLICKKPWVNSRGHSLIASSIISATEQQFNFSYKIPLLSNPLEQYYSISSNFKYTNLNNVKLNSIIFTISRYWNFSKSWQRTINLHYDYNRFTKENIVNTTTLFYPEFIISRTRSRGGFIPKWGDSQRCSINYSNTIFGSDVNFLVIQAQSIWIRTVRNHRFLAYGNLDWIYTKYSNEIPIDLQFFTRENRSIRGYKYKPIVPIANNELVKSIKLIISSLEYQYNIIDKLWGAMFIDSSKIINSNTEQNNAKIGAGIGVRLQLPVGPIKFDLAIPINNKEEHELQFYMGLGYEL